MGFRSDLRAAAVTLLNGYKTANPAALRQVYPGRPASLYPPCGFVDGINEGSILYTQGPRQRAPVVDVILIQGLFDTEEATTLQDALVDGFLDYVTANKHAAGARTLITIDRIEDLPAFTPEWLPEPAVYYATRLSLGALIQEGGLI